MEFLPISKTNSGIHVEGYPDAAKLIKLDGPDTKRLASLSLHRVDLELAVQCLEAINRVSDGSEVEREALWRSAIVAYFKCFQHSAARFQLREKDIYGAEPDGLVAFKHLKALRDKHLVHDENSYAQSIPAAVLNREGKPPKIAKIVCLNIFAKTLDQNNYNNLHLLIEKAKSWMIAEFDEHCNRLAQKLEAESYESLSKREEVSVLPMPRVEEIGKDRNGA